MPAGKMQILRNACQAVGVPQDSTLGPSLFIASFKDCSLLG